MFFCGGSAKKQNCVLTFANLLKFRVQYSLHFKVQAELKCSNT
jgi:hypothetical protein